MPSLSIVKPPDYAKASDPTARYQASSEFAVHIFQYRLTEFLN
jgi:hypothetical protein